MSKFPKPPCGLIQTASDMSGELHRFFAAHAPNITATRHMCNELLNRLTQTESALNKTSYDRAAARAYILDLASQIVAAGARSRSPPFPVPSKLSAQIPTRLTTPTTEDFIQAQQRLHELALLSPRRRLAWIWVKIARLTYKETAVVMGISVGTVHSHVRDAQKSLRKMRKRDGSDEN